MIDLKPTKVIVIGAGWSGLASAKTYLQVASSELNPKCHAVDLTILDDSESPGGVWSRDRLYPGLIANAPNGFYELSDLTMVETDHPSLELLPAHRVSQYLEAYARKFQLYDRIRFNIKVATVRRRSPGANQGWIVTTTAGEVLDCDKLIVASGLHSKPSIPNVPNQAYTGIAVHSKQLGRVHERISNDSSVEHIAVIGGCKSAIEACTVFLEAGKKVSWVIRPSEAGVPLMVVKKDAKPNLIAVNNTRIFGAFSPSIYSTTGFAYTFLHSGTWVLGSMLMTLFWTLMSYVIKRDARYQQSRNGQKIEPVGNSLFYDVTVVSLVYADSPFLKALHQDKAQKLAVHRATPTLLQANDLMVTDTSGRVERVKADAVIWCTGWRPSTDFFEEAEVQRLGLPMSLAACDAEHEKIWSREQVRSELHVQDMIPMLDQKKTRARDPVVPVGVTPYRLYRQVQPISSFAPELHHNHADDDTWRVNTTPLGHQTDQSITFTSFTSSSQTAVTAELSALWAVAWLEGLLPSHAIPTREQAMASVSDIQAFRTLRYGARGITEPSIVIEVQGMHDLLCKDLGVEHERKKRRVRREKGQGLGARIEAGVRELFEPYTGSDYKGVVDEFLRGIQHHV